MTFKVAGLQFKTGELSGPGAVGSAVHVDGKFGIVCVSQQSQSHPLLLASFDIAQGGFGIRPYQQRPALVLGNELVFEADLTVPSEYGLPGAASGSECYYDGAGIYVRLHVDQVPHEWPMLNLATGEVITYPPGQRAHVFKRWRLGVQGNGRVTWLLAVGAQLAAWSSDTLSK